MGSHTKFLTGSPDPAKGTLNTEPMWLIFGAVAMLTSVLLVLAKGWLGKGFGGCASGDQSLSAKTESI
jgi:hypothetical protein